MSRLTTSLALYLIAILAILQARPACCFTEDGRLLPLEKCAVPLSTICLAAGVLSFFIGLSVGSSKSTKG